jgi:hypothetical protein
MACKYFQIKIVVDGDKTITLFMKKSENESNAPILMGSDSDFTEFSVHVTKTITPFHDVVTVKDIVEIRKTKKTYKRLRREFEESSEDCSITYDE